MFDLCEGLFDGVEVWGIGREEPKPCACSLYESAHSSGFVAAEIVHDDDIARFEDGHELLFDIGLEALRIDGAIEHAGCSQPIAAQGTQECQRAPMAMWSKRSKALTLLVPATQRCHIGLDPGLIDEHQSFGIKAALPCLPPQAPASNIGTGLFKSK